MLNRKFFVLMLTLGIVPFSAFAGVKVASVDLDMKGTNGHFNVSIEGRSSELPDMKVTGKTIEITLDKADAFDSISKKIHGAELSASSAGGKAIIKAFLPYEVASDSVSLGWKNNKIEVIFPRGKITKITSVQQGISPKEILPPETEITAPNKVSKESLNEDYLNGLMKENKAPVETAKKEKQDEVTLKQAATTKVNQPDVRSSGDKFSFAGYALKFTVFLALVLGLFYGIVQILKKGVFNRGKLGFLNNAQMVEVLSTTYVSPKRTLMVIRAHKQVFLVANSETGFTFLSEMRDTTGLMKDGEKFVTGTNFDLNLSEADSFESDTLRLKDNIMESAPMPPETGLAKLAAAKDDIVKFSDELKKKAKKLRPIEHRAN
ncbi:MAG TPA: flagellar biosynthetic protein FliO [Bacteriovoracaceae bacterium]|nr:flagellar biosynthetic protein FliO [Bacteriovoracaceae bacterium]